VAEKSGFVPNVFRALAAARPSSRAFLDYHDALMESSDGLSKAERELVVVATSAANNCTYCVVAHGAILRVRTKDPEIADRVATNPYGVELDARQRAIVDLALLIATDSAALGEAELDDARRGRADRRRDLGRRGDHRAVRHVQPARAPDRPAAQPGVLPDGPAAPVGPAARSPRRHPGATSSTAAATAARTRGAG
jgi:uncharacterized peroxidase-related enzyme